MFAIQLYKYMLNQNLRAKTSVEWVDSEYFERHPLKIGKHASLQNQDMMKKATTFIIEKKQYCCSENLLFWKKSERAWFSPKNKKKENNNFFLKSKENYKFRSFIQLIWKNRKKTKKDLVKKKKTKIRANLKMTSKRKDQLKYQTS